jgi:hypothetical protein
MASWSTEPIGDGERQIRLISPDDLLVLCDYAEAGHAQAQRLAEAVWLTGREIKAGAKPHGYTDGPVSYTRERVLCGPYNRLVLHREHRPDRDGHHGQCRNMGNLQRP